MGGCCFGKVENAAMKVVGLYGMPEGDLYS